MKDERIETVMSSCVRGRREYIKLCLDFRQDHNKSKGLML